VRAVFVVLLVVGFVVTYWWLILLVVVVAVAGVAVWAVLTRQGSAIERTRREYAALVARADQQHAWVLAGDDRGIYGDYAPKQID
jgi:cytochrome b subunit of formate dehydrogenase